MKMLKTELSDLTNKLKDKTFRLAVKESVLQDVVKCYKQAMEHMGNFFAPGDETDTMTFHDHVDKATECARALRNACIECPHNQGVLNKSDVFVTLFTHLKQWLLYLQTPSTKSPETEKILLLCKCTLQFLGNAAVGHHDNGCLIWTTFLDLFQLVLSLTDSGLCSCTCMVIYNCLLADPTHHTSELIQTDTGHAIIHSVLSLLSDMDQVWGLLIIEKLLIHPEMGTRMYEDLNNDQKNMLLEIILSQLQKPFDQVELKSNISSQQLTVSVESVEYICDEFKQNAHSVLGLSSNQKIQNEDNSLQTVKQLEIMCIVTSLGSHYTAILEDQGLLKCAINLLHSMQQIGQSGDNPFSNVDKVSQLSTVDSNDPVFGMKCNLIRLIANMSYKHKPNQDAVREFGGINLILDHTNIDGRNPFITQWSIFAIHNLMENNMENQAVIRGLKIDGLAANVDQLRDFGVEADIDGEQVVIRNVKEDLQQPSPFAKRD